MRNGLSLSVVVVVVSSDIKRFWCSGHGLPPRGQERDWDWDFRTMVIGRRLPRSLLRFSTGLQRVATGCLPGFGLFYTAKGFLHHFVLILTLSLDFHRRLTALMSGFLGFARGALWEFGRWALSASGRMRLPSLWVFLAGG